MRTHALLSPVYRISFVRLQKRAMNERRLERRGHRRRRAKRVFILGCGDVVLVVLVVTIVVRSHVWTAAAVSHARTTIILGQDLSFVLLSVILTLF